MIPARSRSKFIAEALRDKLNQKTRLKEAFIKSLKSNSKLYGQEAKDWD